MDWPYGQIFILLSFDSEDSLWSGCNARIEAHLSVFVLDASEIKKSHDFSDMSEIIKGSRLKGCPNQPSLFWTLRNLLVRMDCPA